MQPNGHFFMEGEVMEGTRGPKGGGTKNEDRRRRRTAVLILVLSLAAITTLTTGAIFTDTASVGANTFSTGTVKISAAPASAFITFNNMAPGDVVTSPITISNTGSLQLRYAVTSTTTENVLAGQLQMAIKSNVANCTNAGFGASGSVLYGPGVLGTMAGTTVIGNPAQGAQAGDRVLNAATNEVLCFQVSLPLNTGNAYAGLTSTATFAFQAEQTANNP
jgi:hypothetical protein